MMTVQSEYLRCIMSTSIDAGEEPWMERGSQAMLPFLVSVISDAPAYEPARGNADHLESLITNPCHPCSTIAPESKSPCRLEDLEVFIGLEEGPNHECIAQP